MSLPNWENHAKRFPMHAIARCLPVDQLPRLPRHIVERPRLLKLLDARSPLTLIRAPLGFGKTTLVVDWLRRRDRSDEALVWVTVDSDSRDADGFWRSVVDALSDAGLDHDDGNPARSLRGLAARMVRRSNRPVLLVIDRFEAIHADEIDRELLDLLRSASHLRLIVCLRTHKLFAPYACVDIDSTTIDAQALLLTTAEAGELFTDLDLDLTDEEVATLMKQGGGWPEPTRATGLALAQAGAGSDVVAIAESIGSHYLRERLLPEANRPDLVRFALLTAIPDAFTAPIAELLTGEQSPEALLARFEEQGFLSATTVNGEAVYRWPDAGRHALLAELHRQLPAERISDFRSQLARWYVAHDRPAQALAHAVDAHDWALVMSIVDSSWRTLLPEHPEALSAALTSAPAAVLSSSTRAIAARDILLHAPDDLLLSAISPPSSNENLSATSTDAMAAVDASLAMMIALRRRGQFVHAQEVAHRLGSITRFARASQATSMSELLPSVSLQIGVSRLLAGDAAGAVKPLRSAWENASDHRTARVERDSAGKLALLHAINGDMRQATRWLSRYNAAEYPTGQSRHTIATTGKIAEALIALERHNAAHVDAAVDILSDAEDGDEFWAYLEYARAQCSLEVGDPSDMLAHVDLERRAHGHWLTPESAAAPMLAAVEADLLMATGRGNQASAILEAVGADRGLLRVSRARLALLAGDAERALYLSSDGKWLRAAPTRARIEMLLISAMAAERVGQSRDADRLLQRAVGSAAHAALRRPFSTVPRTELLALAARLPQDSADLRASLDLGRELFPEQIRIVALSEREHLVLEKVVVGLTIQQTATALFVSANTVKSQLQSLYRKLGVNTRPDAIARALQWGLLDHTAGTTSTRS
jgi:LuxR family maltose regulon positive regulatory protein